MAIYYVCPSTGSDLNDGTTFGADQGGGVGAWKSFQKALDTVAAAGSVVYMCAETVEEISTTVDIDTYTGNIASPIVFEGRDGVDGSTEAEYTIRWTGGLAYMVVAATSTSEYYRFRNMTFDAGLTAYSPFQNDLSGVDGMHFEKCKFQNGKNYGFYCDCNNGSAPWILNDCEISGSDGVGFVSSGNSYGEVVMVGCKIYNNDTYGIQAGEITRIHNCLIYGNGDDGIFLEQNACDASVITYNTIYNNGGSGIRVGTNTEKFIISHNSIVNNAAYGIEFDSGTRETSINDYNHFYNNTSGHCNLVTDANINDGTVGYDNQTGDPLFTSPGSTGPDADFIPQQNSPLLQNGANNTTIGALGAEAGSGVAGGTIAVAF